MGAHVLAQCVGILGLIIAWGFPVAFIDSWSNSGGLCQTASWLVWACKGEPPAVSLSVLVDLGLAPSPILGIVQGVPASAACGSVCVTSFCIVWCEFRILTYSLSDYALQL